MLVGGVTVIAVIAIHPHVEMAMKWLNHAG
jgi:hypothetical protein